MDALNDRLEIGGNVFEIIEFCLKRTDEEGNVIEGKYGVNVAKVREVVRLPKINSLASRVKSIAGLFELRGVPIPAIHLASFLGEEEGGINDSMQIIVTEFSGKRAGFIVDSTKRIRRLNWEDVLPVSAEKGASLNGMTLVEDNEFLFIVDLERILASLEARMSGREYYETFENKIAPGSSAGPAPDQVLVPSAGGGGGGGVSTVNDMASDSAYAPGRGPKLLVVDDSKFILNGVTSVLTKLGYRIVTASDGAEGKEYLEKMISGQSSDEPVDLVVTDVEMPKMDGLSLTKWIKDQERLQTMPVVIHSSLSSKANQQAGLTLGVQGYVVKNDIKRLHGLIQEILGENYVPGSWYNQVS